MAMLWALGGLLVVLGVVLVVASLLRRGGAAENPGLWLVSGLVMTGLGVAAISVGALAGGDDDSDDPVAASDTSTTTRPDGSASAGDGGDSGEGGDGDGWDGGDGGSGANGGTREGEPDEPELPACFDDHLAGEPTVARSDHRQLEEGVDQQLLVTMHAADAIALQLVEDGELLAVMRVGDQAVPADDTLHVYDVVDPSCRPLAFTPQDTDDDVAQNHRTVVPLDLGGRSYEVDFLQTGLTPELDVAFRRVR